MSTLEAPRKIITARAFTAIELILVVVCLGIVLAVFLPGLIKSQTRSSRASCSNNMKQIALAFRLWATDNRDRFPMHVSVTNGGTMESLSDGDVYRHFLAMSNELSTPKVLLCPEDKARVSALDFSQGVADTNLSYFVSLDSIEENPASVLSGDRNLTNQVDRKTRLVSVSKGVVIAWNKEMHCEKGHIAFGDGSVAAFSNQRIQAAYSLSEGATNRLAVP